MFRSALVTSLWEDTDTYSPTAIDSAPATRPATPAVRTAPSDAPPPIIPTIRQAVDTMPSLAPSTAALSQPTRVDRCSSLWWWCPAGNPGRRLLPGWTPFAGRPLAPSLARPRRRPPVAPLAGPEEGL